MALAARPEADETLPTTGATLRCAAHHAGASRHGQLLCTYAARRGGVQRASGGRGGCAARRPRRCVLQTIFFSNLGFCTPHVAHLSLKARAQQESSSSMRAHAFGKRNRPRAIRTTVHARGGVLRAAESLRFLRVGMQPRRTGMSGRPCATADTASQSRGCHPACPRDCPCTVRTAR
eukprot:365051-Chlamydomonas_euryale.AAC.8